MEANKAQTIAWDKAIESTPLCAKICTKIKPPRPLYVETKSSRARGGLRTVWQNVEETSKNRAQCCEIWLSSFYGEKCGRRYGVPRTSGTVEGR
jgi:hypothetical protein